MIVRSPDKAAARALSALTGAPYQSCLVALPVLRGLPQGTDHEELAAVLAGNDPHVHLTIRLDDRDHVETALERPWRPWLPPRADIYLKDRVEEGIPLFTAVVPPHIELPDSTTLLIEDYFFERMSRPGVWRTDLRLWTRACKAALQTDADDWSIDFGARRADQSLVPPDDVSDIEISEVGLRTAEAVEAVPGPGFEWLRLPWSAVGAPRPRYRDTPNWQWSDGGWGPGGTATTPPETLTFPAVLLEAWRDLALRIPPAEEPPEPPEFHRWDGGAEDPSWYGLRLPDYSVLWLRLAPHPLSEAAP